jgi:hypothetical protein
MKIEDAREGQQVREMATGQTVTVFSVGVIREFRGGFANDGISIQRLDGSYDVAAARDLKVEHSTDRGVRYSVPEA